MRFKGDDWVATPGAVLVLGFIERLFLAIPPSAAAVGLLLMTPFIVIAVRSYLAAVYITNEGVTIRNTAKTYSLPWAEVEGFADGTGRNVSMTDAGWRLMSPLVAAGRFGARSGGTRTINLLSQDGQKHRLNAFRLLRSASRSEEQIYAAILALETQRLKHNAPPTSLI